MVDMPNARMAPDGELSVGASFFRNTQHYNFGFQALPWVEASFRYTGLQNFDAAYPVYYDRSFALKLRLWDETEIFPAVALGINDVVGTGIYASEFLVASKRIGALDFTAGIGWGRMASTKTVANPLKYLKESFGTRPIGFDPGATNFNTLFQGPNVGVFGGITWQTPVNGLALSLEYSSDRFAEEDARGTFTPHSQFNIGASYQVMEATTLSLAWIYGESISASLSLQLTPLNAPSVRLGPPPPVPQSRSADEQRAAVARLSGRFQPTHPTALVDEAFFDTLWRPELGTSIVAVNGRVLALTIANGNAAAVCETIARQAANSFLNLDAVQISRGGENARCPVASNPLMSLAAERRVSAAPVVAAPQEPLVINAAGKPVRSTAQAMTDFRRNAGAQSLTILAVRFENAIATIYYTNNVYFHERDAISRLSNQLMADAPPEIERFRLIRVQRGVPQREFTVLRSMLERRLDQEGNTDLSFEETKGDSPPLNNLILAADDRYPKLTYSIFPQFRQQLFDPSNPFAVAFPIAGAVNLELFRGFSVQVEAEVSLWDNFNTGRLSDSVLPHVRTDFVQYFTQGKHGISDLEANYRFRLAPNVFGIVRAGYLESMFAGVGGEVLWRPEGQRWALGFDLYGVKQREFNRLLGLQNYSTVTGHISLYYASPWYGLNMTLRAGKYLAGDTGLSVELTRRFDSGVEIGAFFTKTNVSAARFGEGSFDKGIIVRLPVAWLAPIHSQNELGMELRSVQRDGGQRLLGDAILYEETRRSSRAEMSNRANYFPGR